MSSILLEPIFPNLTKVSTSGEQLRDLWKLFTKVKDCTLGGRRLENLYWRLWFKSSANGGVTEGDKVASLLEAWKDGGDALKVDKPTTTTPAFSPNVVNNHITTTTATAAAVAVTNHADSIAIANVSASAISSAEIAEAAGTLTTCSSKSSICPPPPSSSIQISRVASNLKALASAAAAVAPPPMTNNVTSAAPPLSTRIPSKQRLIPTGNNVTIANNLPSNSASALSSAYDKMTPSKVSNGFFQSVASEQSHQQSHQQSLASLKNQQTSPDVLTQDFDNQILGRNRAASMEPSTTKSKKTARRKSSFSTAINASNANSNTNTNKKKFFINDDSESFDSGGSDIESAEEIDSPFRPTKPPKPADQVQFLKQEFNATTTAAATTTTTTNANPFTQSNPPRLRNPMTLTAKETPHSGLSSQFGKINPDCEAAAAKKPSNLSNLLKAPPRGMNNHSSMRMVHLQQQQRFNLGANHFFKPPTVAAAVAAALTDDFAMPSQHQQLHNPFQQQQQYHHHQYQQQQQQQQQQHQQQQYHHQHNTTNLNNNINDNIHNVSTPFCESESLRRGIQLERKPLFDYSLGYDDPTANSFSSTPSAW